jgi:SmpA/OmlA family protein
MRLLMTAVLLSGAAASLGAQATVTIDPGMTREQVVAKLGEPLSTRSYDGHTYLLYKNGCEKTCGMNDLVVLDSGKVTDAVFRATGRKYSGTSSSPRMISMAEAKRSNGGGEPLAMPSGEAKPASAPPKTPPAKTEAKRAPAKSAPAKTEPVKSPAKPEPAKAATKAAPPPTKTTTAPVTKPAAAPAKTAVAPPAKTVTPPPPKTNAVPAKKDTTKKPPAGHEG